MLLSNNSLRMAKTSKDVLTGTHCVKWNTNRDTPASVFRPWPDDYVRAAQVAFPQDAGIE
jgi:hypothetical protein